MSSMLKKFCTSHLFVYLIVVFFAQIGPCAYAQGNIDIPQPKPKPKPQPTISVKLAAEKAGERVYFTTTEWDKLPIDEKVEINKIGLLIGQGDNAFLLSLFNNMGRGVCGKTVSFQEAFNKTGNQLPTKTQMQTVKNNKRKIGDALEIFGGDHICSAFFWCIDGSYLNFGSHNTFNNEAMFRIATNDVEAGFHDVIVQKKEDELFDYVGAELTDWEKQDDYLQLVGLRGKFGYINKDGSTVIPIMFDCVDGNKVNYSPGQRNTWSGEYLMSVCINSNWGFINNTGDIVIPTIFDAVENRCNPIAAVEKEGLKGIINTKGEYILPVQYEDIEGDYYKKDIFFVKKDGKYGFLDSDYKMVIPFKYDFVTGFYRYSKLDDNGLCAVGYNGKYGYIDKRGIEVIPLSFDFAEEFHNGLAGIVLDNKLGFIDTKGNIVIAPQFYVDKVGLYVSYSYGFGNSRKTIGCDYFDLSPYIAIVRKSQVNYVVINNVGDIISQHTYRGVKERDKYGYTVELIDNRIIYLDLAGHEYSSREERDSNYINTLEFLANKGFVKFMLNCADYYRNIGEYQRSYDWYLKAYNHGSILAMRDLGDMFYWNNRLEKSYVKALEWYTKYVTDNTSQYKSEVYEKIGRMYYEGGYGLSRSYHNAFEFFNKSESDASYYFIGWMYEHGQGVGKDLIKAIDYYKKSNGIKDANERIASLQSQ